jgi:hypothetical protein
MPYRAKTDELNHSPSWFRDHCHAEDGYDEPEPRYQWNKRTVKKTASPQVNTLPHQ